MLCNQRSQTPQAFKQNSSKNIQQQQQHSQQHVQGTNLWAPPAIAADRKQGCKSIRHGSYIVRLDWAAGLLSWLAVALVLSVAAPAHAQPQGTCPVSINYAASLGQGGGDNSNVPIFVGSVGITNNANVSTALHRVPTTSCAVLHLLHHLGALKAHAMCTPSSAAKHVQHSHQQSKCVESIAHHQSLWESKNCIHVWH